MSKDTDDIKNPILWVDELNFPPQPSGEKIRVVPRHSNPRPGTAVYAGEVIEGPKLSIMCLLTEGDPLPAGDDKPAMEKISGGSSADEVSDGTALVSPAPSAPKITKPVVDALNFMGHRVLKKPPMVLVDALYRGSIMSIGGSSKSHKSFSLIDLALCVATGKEFWQIESVPGKVIYINLELQSFALSERLVAIAGAEGIKLAAGQLGVWNLRGQNVDITEIADVLISHYPVGNPSGDISLIIIDPIYKCYGTRDENSATQMTSLFMELERLANETGAAVAFAAHFAKGDSSVKSAIDRISGSGVFGRYPDAIFTVTQDKKSPPNRYEGETILRNFEAIPPFSLEWTYPLLRVVASTLPASGFTAGTGRPPKFTIADVVKIVSTMPLTAAAWEKIASAALGMSSGSFKKYKRDATVLKQVAKDASGKWYAVGSPAASGAPLTATSSAIDPSFEPADESIDTSDFGPLA